MVAARQRTPAGLEAAGRRLWRQLTAEFVLNPREIDLLERACRQADDVARCEAVVLRDGVEATGSTGQAVVSPYLLEARQGRLAVARLLGQIGLPDEDDIEQRDVLSRRAGRASRARRLRHERSRGLRDGTASA
jgi:hypothetical protein